MLACGIVFTSACVVEGTQLWLPFYLLSISTADKFLKMGYFTGKSSETSVFCLARVTPKIRFEPTPDSWHSIIARQLAYPYDKMSTETKHSKRRFTVIDNAFHELVQLAASTSTVYTCTVFWILSSMVHSKLTNLMDWYTKCVPNCRTEP